MTEYRRNLLEKLVGGQDFRRRLSAVTIHMRLWELRMELPMCWHTRDIDKLVYAWGRRSVEEENLNSKLRRHKYWRALFVNESLDGCERLLHRGCFDENVSALPDEPGAQIRHAL